MRYPKEMKESVRSLRSQGKTYAEILDELKIVILKATLSDWCADVPLPSWYQNKIDAINNTSFNKAQRTAWASNKIKREKFLAILEADNRYLVEKIKDNGILKLALAFLYLGEGSKWRSHSGAMLGSSDPDIVRLYVRLLGLCYGIQSNRLKCRISYRTDQDIDCLEKYWSDVTGIPLVNFYKTKPDPRTAGKPTKKVDYMGVCVITGAGTNIQLELELIPKLILKGL